jgi:hypothetical protein
VGVTDLSGSNQPEIAQSSKCDIVQLADALDLKLCYTVDVGTGTGLAFVARIPGSVRPHGDRVEHPETEHGT